MRVRGPLLVGMIAGCGGSPTSGRGATDEPVPDTGSGGGTTGTETDTSPPTPTETGTGTTPTSHHSATSPTTGPVGAADCAEAPVDIAVRAGDVRKVCLFADGSQCVLHADDPNATSCAVHASLLNFEWKLSPPQERNLLEFYDWTPVAWDHGTLALGSGFEPDALVLSDVPLGTPITVTATHDASGVTYEVVFAFGADALSVLSVRP